MKKLNEKLKKDRFFEYVDNDNKIKIWGDLIEEDLYLLKEIQVFHNFNLENIKGLSKNLLNDLNKEKLFNKSWEILEQEKYQTEIVSEIFNQNPGKYDAYKLIIKPDTYNFNKFNYDSNREIKGQEDHMLINKKQLEGVIKTLLGNSKW